MKYGLSNTEAIEAIRNNYPPENYSVLREALDMAIEALERTRWIPVSERLPDVKQAILATNGISRYTTTYLPEWDSSFTHWIPLPEPPEMMPEKMQNERIVQSRLIQTLEDEIDLLTMRNDPEQQKIANRQYMSKQLINEVGEVVAQGEVGIDFSTQNDFTGNVQCGSFHEKCLNNMEGT